MGGMMSTRPKLGTLVLGAALAVPLLARASTEPPAGDVGPFRLGMSFADARAAAPRAGWSETISDYTHRPVALEGRNALRLEGLAFDVGLRPLAYGGYRLEIAHAEDGGRASQDRCAAAFAVATGRLGVRVGPLGPVTPLSAAEREGLPVGFPDAVAGQAAETLAPGQAPQAQAFHPGGDGTAMWLAGLRREGLTVLVAGRYFDRSSAMSRASCVVWARLTALPPRPAFEWVDLTRLPSPPAPSLPARRRSFSGLASPLPAAADVEVVCDVDRHRGVVANCKAAGAIAETLARPAERQGNAVRLDPAALDPDSDIPLRLRLPLRIDPADGSPFIPPDGRKPLKNSEVTWTHQPTYDSLMRLYPARALREAVGARVSVICRIKDEGDLACADERVSADDAFAEIFDGWGVKAAALYQAGPTLPDGQPSAGRWVKLTFALVVPRD